MAFATDRHHHARFLLNRECRIRLARGESESLLEAPPDLASARRLGHALEVSGSRLFLLARLNAALSHIALQYLTYYDCRPEWQALSFRGRSLPFRQLGETCASFQEHYRLPGIPEAALRAAADSAAAFAGRRQLMTGVCLLAVQEENPALEDLAPLFRENDPFRQDRYSVLVERLSGLPFDPQARAPWGQALKALLLTPIKASPHDLAGQVDYVTSQWRQFLPVELLQDLAMSAAIVREEAALRAPGPGPVALPDYRRDFDRWQPPAFSADSDWMPNVVLVAKSVHVWLGQLGRQYRTSLVTLDQIPGAELDRLAAWGFNTLWLIGIWERSPASRRIKQMRGNPEAEASAYALADYRIASELGGEEALADLERRCAERGIRLACDVVPNHTGIDADWVRQHPDWYIQTASPPYPSYRFMGPDLCAAAEISIRIEDGYWDHSDAAVVFEHVDHRNGRRRYIYHGNDGTHMPWNDTAQLDFLLPEVRRAMSDIIVKAARRFRVIRFDAAMTLARKHFRRLWYPSPGDSAGVPSRSAFAMEDQDFDAAFPHEFWREIVDRIGREAPDTLLIAEAFWLMESYFVRNLGMHRVYNSAFMHLLKQEENAKFRKLVKDTLAYNPEILKRYVNFMNNPDEATAVEQFGKGDKYFGTAVLLATLPGLPMFGHGQIEGYREKYGMEFRRAYWDEQPDAGFIAHHEAQICPLLRHRHLFSDLARFAFYDLQGDQGVNENVIAYSNGTEENTFLVIFNNAPEPAVGRISVSAPQADPRREGEAQPGRPLAAELGLDLTADRVFCRFRDHRSGLEYLRPAASMRQGLQIALDGYQYHLFHDFRTLSDPEGHWARRYANLGEAGTRQLDAAPQSNRRPELRQAAQRLLTGDRLLELGTQLALYPWPANVLRELDGLSADFELWLRQFRSAAGLPAGIVNSAALRQRLAKAGDRLRRASGQTKEISGLRPLWTGDSDLPPLAGSLLIWQLLEEVLQQAYPNRHAERLLGDLDNLGVTAAWLEQTARDAGAADLLLAQSLLQAADRLPHPAASRRALAELSAEPAVSRWLGINVHADETWFDREKMQLLCGALVFQDLLLPTGSMARLKTTQAIWRRRLEKIAASGCRLEKFLSLR